MRTKCAVIRTLVKCDMLLKKFCKSFNTTTIEVKDKHILSLSKHINSYLMKRLNAMKGYMGK